MHLKLCFHLINIGRCGIYVSVISEEITWSVEHCFGGILVIKKVFVVVVIVLFCFVLLFESGSVKFCRLKHKYYALYLSTEMFKYVLDTY